MSPPILRRAGPRDVGKLAAVTDDVMPTIAARLRSTGQRLTPKRRDLLDVLARSNRPLTIPEIVGDRALPQSSVYRNLVVLEQAAIVRRVVTNGDFARYELVEDLTDHHHHLACTRCGSVQDLALPEALERSIADVAKRAAARRGFAASEHRLDVLGLCRNCRAR